jgi:hypothetical protein
MNRIKLLLLCCCLFTAAHSQTGACTDHNEITIQSDGEAAFNDYVRRFVAAGKHLNTDVKTIPAVVHIIYDNLTDSLPLERAQSQIEAMTQCFRRQNPDTLKTRPPFKALAADCQVEFCLAGRTPQGQPATDVVWHKSPGFIGDSLLTLMQQTQWPPLRYLNIWVTPGGEGGSSSLPWEVGSNTDGFWVGAQQFGTVGHNLKGGFEEGGASVHEAGHYLGLWHTFHNSTQYLFNCDFPPCDSTGDYVCDTPLDWELAWAAEQCPDGERGCPDGSSFLTMRENFMAYAFDTCSTIFTHGQRIRMRAALDSLRAELVSPANLVATGCQSSVVAEERAIAGTFFDVFPNPASRFLKIRFLKILASEAQLRLTDGFGSVIFEEKIPPAVAEWRVDLQPGIPGGIYFLEINSEGGRETRILRV